MEMLQQPKYQVARFVSTRAPPPEFLAFLANRSVPGGSSPRAGSAMLIPVAGGWGCSPGVGWVYVAGHQGQGPHCPGRPGRPSGAQVHLTFPKQVSNPEFCPAQRVGARSNHAAGTHPRHCGVAATPEGQGRAWGGRDPGLFKGGANSWPALLSLQKNSNNNSKLQPYCKQGKF